MNVYILLSMPASPAGRNILFLVADERYPGVTYLFVWYTLINYRLNVLSSWKLDVVVVIVLALYSGHCGSRVV